MYVAVVECSVPLSMKIVLLMPESDITGDVIKGRNIAIGVMCAVCVVAVIIACVFVALVLMPLEDVSDRMYDAAELNDTSNDEALSVLERDRRAAGTRTTTCAKKLNEMKAFVPQTAAARGGRRRRLRHLRWRQQAGGLPKPPAPASPERATLLRCAAVLVPAV